MHRRAAGAFDVRIARLERTSIPRADDYCGRRFRLGQGGEDLTVPVEIPDDLDPTGDLMIDDQVSGHGEVANSSAEIVPGGSHAWKRRKVARRAIEVVEKGIGRDRIVTRDIAPNGY